MIIKIGDFDFELQGKSYEAGQALTHGEAWALNGLRAERIREKLRALIARAGEITGEKLLELKAQAENLDKTFEFLPPQRPQKRTTSELEILINEIAGERTRASGGSMDFTTDPEVIDQARGILAARREAAARILEEDL